MNPAALFGLIASALVVGAAGALLFPRLPRIVALAAAGLVLAPVFAGESVAMWVHGLLGQPSATLAQLALLRCLGGTVPALGAARRWAFVAGAGAFYGSFLGNFAGFDFFSLGYRPAGLFVGALLPFAAWLHRRGESGWLVILGVDLAAYALGLFDNAWNALLDPVVVLLALAAAFRKGRPGRSAGECS